MSIWNPNDYQGRSRRQVENAHKINNWLITILVAMLAAIFIFT